MSPKKYKLDPHVISLKQKWETTWIIKRFKKRGITITALEIKSIVHLVGRSRRKVYAYIVNTYSENE